MKKIQEICSKDTFSVRHPFLRAGKPIESCIFEGDDSSTTVHFGLFINKKLVGVVSVFKKNNLTFLNENQYQIRGMAVLPEFQKKGFGKDLVEYCEDYIKNEKGTLIWFNARENAVPFYEKLDFRKFGNPFTINDIGIHFLMVKEFGQAYE